jgi:hypothetical protein
MSDIIMSTDFKSDAQWHLADALSEDILNTGADDLFAEAVADHGNRRALVTEFDRIFRRGSRRVRKQEYIERLKRVINLPGPTPSLAIVSIGALAVIIVASALSDRPFRSADKQPTNFASSGAGATEPIVVARTPKVAQQGLPSPAPAPLKIEAHAPPVPLDATVDLSEHERKAQPPQTQAAPVPSDTTVTTNRAGERGVALNGVREEARVGTRTTLDVLDAQQELVNARTQMPRRLVVMFTCTTFSFGRSRTNQAVTGASFMNASQPPVDKSSSAFSISLKA